MYNLHCHSLLSDGVLLPSEIAVRFAAVGYKLIAITDHVDYSNIELITDSILKFCRFWPKDSQIKVLPGVELTHLALNQFKPLSRLCRKKGIKVIVGHGQTPAEPVIKGTNIACLEADIDILAHPGYITEEETKLAKEKGIFLELSSRKLHGDTNSHVAALALKFGAKLILNTDGHAPCDIITPEELKEVGKMSGLTESNIINLYKDLEDFLKTKGAK